MNRISHQTARHLVQASADGVLSDRQQKRLTAHLAGCAACRQSADRLQALEDLLHRSMQQRWQVTRPKFAATLLQTRARRLTLKRMFLKITVLTTGAALLAALLLAVNSLFSSRINPAEANTPIPIGSRVPSGIYSARTDFGFLVFQLRPDYFDPSSARITRIEYQFSGWTCGTLSYDNVIVDATDWILENGSFSATTTFAGEANGTAVFHMYLDGSWDPDAQTLSGTWRQESDRAQCSGIWQAAVPER